MRDGLVELREKMEEMGEELAAGKASRAHAEARLAEAETTLRNAREGQPAIESTAATIHVRPSPASHRTDDGDTASKQRVGAMERARAAPMDPPAAMGAGPASRRRAGAADAAWHGAGRGCLLGVPRSG